MSPDAVISLTLTFGAAYFIATAPNLLYCSSNLNDFNYSVRVSNSASFKA